MMLFAMLQSCQKQSLTASGESLTKSNESAATYNVQLGLAYLKEGDVARAKRKLITAIKQAPKLPDTNEAMAYFLENTGEVEQAEAYYLKAISLAPGAGATLNNYGTFLCRTKRYKAAETYFLKATRDANYLYTAGAYENAGLCMEIMADYDKAEAYFLKALRHDPYRKQSLNELTRIAIKQNQPEKGLAYLNKYPDLVAGDNELNALRVKLIKGSLTPSVNRP